MLRAYKPHVQCTSTPSFADTGSCTKLLGTLPVSHSHRIFGRRPSSKTPRVSVVVPEIFRDGEYHYLKIEFSHYLNIVYETGIPLMLR